MLFTHILLISVILSQVENLVELNHKYAIAILIDQDWRTANAFTGHDWISNSMSMLAYSHSGFIAIVLADYIRRLGYPARAHYSRKVSGCTSPDSSLGGIGRNVENR